MPAISGPPTPVTTPPAGVTSGPPPSKQRLLGVDVARGVALVGMMAVHAFPTLASDDTPTVATVVAAGRSAVTFVLLSGVGLAFLSGGRTVVQGRERTAVAAGLAVRAVLIGALGLVLGLLQQVNGVTERPILPFYGLLFLLAIPLLGLAPLTLAGIATVAIAVGPVLLITTATAGLPGATTESDLVPADVVRDPLGLLVRLCFTGEYPVVLYIGYLCAGLAIGRLDLTSRRVAWWLLGAGAAVAVAARAVSAVVLYPLGGLAQLIVESGPGGDGGANVAQTLLWDHGDLISSWWYLALPAPHSHTPIDMSDSLGSAVAVLGAALLLTRVPAVARLLRPLAVAGTMVLTLYTLHLVVLATGVLEDSPLLLFVLMVAGAVVFALLWGRWFGQGPLERPVTVAAGWARRATTRVLADRPSTTADTKVKTRPVSPTVVRRIGQFLGPLAIAGVLALVLWAGARSVAPVANSPGSGLRRRTSPGTAHCPRSLMPSTPNSPASRKRSSTRPRRSSPRSRRSRRRKSARRSPPTSLTSTRRAASRRWPVRTPRPCRTPKRPSTRSRSRTADRLNEVTPARNPGDRR